MRNIVKKSRAMAEGTPTQRFMGVGSKMAFDARLRIIIGEIYLAKNLTASDMLQPEWEI